MAITFVTADTVAFTDYLHVLQTAYADYIVPLYMDATHLREEIAHNNILLNASIAARDAEQLIGLAMLGKRGQRGWVGGVGIIPAYRKQGHSRAMMHALIEQAHQHNITQLQLECITQNTPAHRLYQSLGFKTARQLHVIEGTPQQLPATSHPVETAPVADVLARYDKLHPTAHNPWQRQIEGLTALAPRLEAFATRNDNGEITAAAIGVFLPVAIRYVDLGFIDGHADHLTAILAHLHRTYPDALGSLINIAEDDPAWPVLQSLAYQPTLSQYEMFLTL